MKVSAAVSDAERLLNERPANSGSDPRWQAIIGVGEHIEKSPEEVWQFTLDARVGADDDLEAALITVLLEHLIEQHQEYQNKAYEIAKTDDQMGEMLESCW